MRKCGTCKMCCTGLIHLKEVPFVEEGQDRNPCPKLCDSGCSIYENRPVSPCRGFKCNWIEGVGEDSGKPDKSGILSFSPSKEVVAIFIFKNNIDINFYGEIIQYGRNQDKQIEIYDERKWYDEVLYPGKE